MKRIFTFLSLMALTIFATAQDLYTVETVNASSFNPAALTILVGDTVQFVNTGGSHNVNGTQATWPSNPESFGNDVGAGWTYQYVFNTAGVYDYHCNPHQGSMIGQITVMEIVMGTTGLIIAGVLDPQPSGGAGPKSLELYALEDIPDLSIYGLGSANNGGGTGGEEFTFPGGSLSAGDCILLTDTASLEKFQTFFGFDPDFLVDGGGPTAINGDDAIELFMNGTVVDVFGDINVDGTDQTWEYTDGWAYRVNGSGPDGTTFVESNWTYSGIDALQDGTFTMNSQFASPFPNCTYSPAAATDILANNDNATTAINTAINIDVLANDQTPNGITTLTVTSISVNGTAVPNGTTDITYTPGPDFCGMDVYTYEICDATSCSEATITITINCPILYPAYDIGLVTADSDMEGIGDSVGINANLTGIVHGIDYRGGDGYSFAIIGSDNEGINVFNFNQVSGYEAVEGDEITVQGEIDDFRGLTEIVPVTIVLNSTGNDLVTPTDVTTLDESVESQLIRMVDMTFADPAQWLGDGSGFNVDITDGTNTFTMRIDDDTDAASQPVPTGTSFNITGIGWQFDNDAPYLDGYQIQPRYLTDIEEVIVVVITANNDMATGAIDEVLNIDVLANDQLPNVITALTITSAPTNGTATANNVTDITYTPATGYCGSDELTYEICDANGCSQATVSISVLCPVDYPVYDIGLVTADADGNGLGDSLNVNATLTGVVHGNDFNGGDILSFTIIGSDNEGINVFNFATIDGYVVTEGDEITVQGEIIDFNGLTEIEPVTIVLNSTGNDLVTPTDVTSLGEDTESQLIKFTDMTIVDNAAWVGDGSSFNVNITDGTNTFTMRIDDDTDAASMPVPMGTLQITGIGSQFDNDEPYTEGYQIFPRYMADISAASSTINPDLAAEINVYPNPVSELLQIDSKVELDEIRISNVLGQQVRSLLKPNAQLGINVASFESGVYFLTVVKGDEVWTTSFVKK